MLEVEPSGQRNRAGTGNGRIERRYIVSLPSGGDTLLTLLA